jgi:hypothetical protein
MGAKWRKRSRRQKHRRKRRIEACAGVVKLFSRFHTRAMKIFGTTWLVSAFVSDIIIAAYLTWYLASVVSHAIPGTP